MKEPIVNQFSSFISG